MSGRRTPNGSGQSVVGAGISVLFMLYWNYLAIRGGAPFIFPVVGAFGLYTSVKGFVRALGEYRKRKLNQDVYDYDSYTSSTYNQTYSYTSDDNRYCPYCGAKVSTDFIYCPYCGRQLHSN